MKSPMIEAATCIRANEKQHYSHLLVLRSAAGWYVGTQYLDPELGHFEPGSRDTSYFATKVEAEDALERIELGFKTDLRVFDGPD